MLKYLIYCFYQTLLASLPNKVKIEKDAINLKYVNNI